MKKVTYTLDDETVAKVKRAADASGRPQSSIVREAVAAYQPAGDRLPDAERQRILRLLDFYMPRVRGKRSAQAAAREIREIRAARRASSLRRERMLERQSKR
jgi:hypothetical protein